MSTLRVDNLSTTDGLTNIPVSELTTSVALALGTGASLIGYKGVDTDAVTRKLSDKVGDIVNVKDFGAVADGTTDSSAAFLAACNSLGETGGTVNFVGRYYIGTDLVVPNSITIKGAMSRTGSNGNNSTFDYSKPSALVIGESASITLGNGSGIDGCLLVASNLTYPVLNADNFEGTAVKVGGDDAFVIHSTLLGFQWGITSSGYQRFFADWNKFDCTNCIDMDTALDTPVIAHQEAWPFTSINQAVNNPTGEGYKAYYRNGTFIKFHGQVDGGRIQNCFAYSWQNSFWISDPIDVQLIDCACDSTTFDGQTNVGFYITGYSIRTLILGGSSGAQSTNIHVDCGNDLTNTVRIFGHIGYAPAAATGTGILIGQLTNEAHVLVSECVFSGFNIGIDANVTPSGITAINNYFDSINVPIRMGDTALLNSTIHGNRYNNCTNIGPGEFSYRENQDLVDRDVAFGGGLTHRTSVANGTVASPTAIAAYGQVRSDVYSAYIDGGFRDVAHISCQLTGTVGTGDYSSALILGTVPGGGTSIVDGVTIQGGGSLFPVVDNISQLGGANARWTSIYATSGTINTSDERKKKDIADLDEAEKKCAVALKGKIKSFKFKEGDSKVHIGVIAQEVKATFEEYGLNPDDYAILSYDEWDYQPEVTDADGVVVKAAVEAGSIFGVRYEQLLCFIIGSI